MPHFTVGGSLNSARASNQPKFPQAQSGKASNGTRSGNTLAGAFSAELLIASKGAALAVVGKIRRKC